jgi:hypothetical protein
MHFFTLSYTYTMYVREKSMYFSVIERDAPDSKSGSERSVGSSPTARTRSLADSGDSEDHAGSAAEAPADFEDQDFFDRATRDFSAAAASNRAFSSSGEIGFTRYPLARSRRASSTRALFA